MSGLGKYCPAIAAGYLVDTDDLAASAVLAVDLAATSIAGSHVKGSVLAGSHLKDSTVIGSNLAAAAISSASHIAAGLLVGSHIAGSVLKGSHLADSTIKGSNLVAAAISSASHIASGIIAGSHHAMFSTLLATIAAGTPGTYTHSLGVAPSFISLVARGTAAGTAPPVLSTADATNIVIANSVAAATIVIDVYAIK